MAKRNFILLIIVLVIATIAVFGFLYFRQESTPPTGEEGGGSNFFFAQFNPFSSKPATPPGDTTTPVDVSGYVPSEPETPSKLQKISTMPIAGFGLFNKERLKEIPIEPATPATETPPEEVKKTTTVVKKPVLPATEFMTAVRYVDRATGNIYQTFADKIEERKFSLTIIPKVYDAYFGNKAESVVMRYLKDDERTIETFVGVLPKELLVKDPTVALTEPEQLKEIKGSFLPNNVKDVSLSPDGLKIFYLFESGDSIIGTTLNFLNNKKSQIFDSPFTEWLSFWPNNNIITLSTKPSYTTPGYMYSINSAGQGLSKILGGINGLTTLTSPNGKIVLYSDNSLSLNIYQTDNRNSSPLSVRTLPEKCIWGKASDTLYCAVPKGTVGNLYPDTWYQGEVSFNDQIWKIDTVTGNATLLADPALVGRTEIDGIKLATDEGENYLFFVNKKDSFLWKLDLK